MARKQKNQSAAIRFGPVLKAILLCLFIGGSGIGYVCQKNQIDKLGQEKTKCETRLKELVRQNKLQRDTLAGLRSPQSLDKRVKELKLGLGPPQQSQKHTLIEPPSAMESIKPNAETVKANAEKLKTEKPKDGFRDFSVSAFFP